MHKISEEQLKAFCEEIDKHADAMGAVRRFGARQLHSLTGYAPGGFHNLEGMRQISAIRPGAVNEQAARLGLTSLPGVAKALMNKEMRGKVLPTALKQQWAGTNAAEKALLIGAPALATTEDVLSEDDGHKGERLGAGIAGTAAGMFMGAMPLAGGVAASLAAGKAGGLLARGVDKLRRHASPPPVAHVQAPPNPEDARGSVAVERELSPAAAGQRPEVLG